PWGLDGQQPPLEGFVSTAVEGVARFADLGVAIEEGYRKLGPDFPGMGEHWINPALVIAGDLDPRRPPVLSYTRVSGERKLVGFAFTRVLAPGESAPDEPFPAAAWHDHSGGVDEESVLLTGPASAHGTLEGFRLSMVHVWAPLGNADGLLSQNNWALPFLRAGLPLPERPTITAARALSTRREGLAFYRVLLKEGLGLRDQDLETASSAFAEAGERADSWVARQGGTRADAAGIEELERIWTELWEQLRAELPVSVFGQIRILDLS
ncbi:MAG: hypothetical protein HKO53_07065, partial [Gemmatimonadetes bacterium]|nr:hypothetical protein [Gemmatimonadota bacterium]